MNDFNRGDIIFVENPMQIPHGPVLAGNHLAVVIQNNTGNEHLNNLIIAYIISRLKVLVLPTHVVLRRYRGPRKVSIVQTEQLATIDKEDVISVINHLAEAGMGRVDRAIIISLRLKVALNFTIGLLVFLRIGCDQMDEFYAICCKWHGG